MFWEKVFLGEACREELSFGPTTQLTAAVTAHSCPCEPDFLKLWTVEPQLISQVRPPQGARVEVEPRIPHGGYRCKYEVMLLLLRSEWTPMGVRL